MHVEGAIESTAFGGQGILKKDGLVIFVPYTVQGDRVVAEITKTKKNYAFGKLLSVISKSPFRTSPPCAYFGTCGGCTLQHIEYPTQLAIKKKFVVDALERIAKVPCTVEDALPAKSIWGYRRHITMSLEPRARGFEASFFSPITMSSLGIDKCLIFERNDEGALQKLQTALQKLDHGNIKKGSVKFVRSASSQLICVFVFDEGLPSNYKEFTKELLSTRLCEGVIWKEKNNVEPYGKIDTYFQIGELKFEFSPLGFVQNHPEQSVNIYLKLCEMVNKADVRVIDVYCGIGVSSLLLAKKGLEVVGIEQSEESILMAKKNMERNQVANVRFICGSAENLIGSYLTGEKETVLILNPPRNGLSKEVIRKIVSGRPKEIIYISCQPSTLARDIGELVAAGYDVKLCQPYDMFPQTTHIETILQLSRSELHRFS